MASSLAATLHGRCSFGETCGFSHENGELSGEFVGDLSPGQEASQVCRHHQAGRCTFGNLCRFSHADEEDSGKGKGKSVRYAPY